MRKKKILLTIVATAVLFLSTAAISFANNGLDRYSLKAQGRFQYDTDKSGMVGDSPKDVIYDAEDLITIEKQIKNGKAGLAESINEYPLGNASELNTFESYAVAISDLSNIPEDRYFYDKKTVTDDVSELKLYIKEDNAYYPCDTNGIKTSDAMQFPNTADLIEFTSVTPENLSVGTMAIANKEFILGIGSDNNEFKQAGLIFGREVVDLGSESYKKGSEDGYATGYEEGYNQGYADGRASNLVNASIEYVYHTHTGSSTAKSGCYTNPVYHTHTGNSSSGGGCYGNAVTTSVKKSANRVNKHTHGNSFTGVPDECWECSKCGACTMDKSLCTWYENSTTYSINCGKSTSTIEKYVLGCGKTETTIDKAVIVYN